MFKVYHRSLFLSIPSEIFLLLTIISQKICAVSGTGTRKTVSLVSSQDNHNSPIFRVAFFANLYYNFNLCLYINFQNISPDQLFFFIERTD